MFRETKKRIRQQADKLVPDVWTEVREAAIHIMPQNAVSKERNFMPRNRIRRIAVLAASIVFVIVSTVFIFSGIINNNHGIIGNNGTRNATEASKQPTPNAIADKIVWNHAGSSNLIAGTLKKVTKKEWSEEFSFNLPKSMSCDYYLVYSISKSDDKESHLMCGYIEQKFSETQWMGAYISKSNVAPYVFTAPQLEKSLIEGVEAVIGRHEETETSWGAFRSQECWVSFEAHGFEDKPLIDFIKDCNTK